MRVMSILIIKPSLINDEFKEFLGVLEEKIVKTNI